MIFMWLSCGILLSVFELTIPGTFYFLALGVGTVGGALAAALETSFALQLSAWLITSLLALKIMVSWIRNRSFSPSLDRGENLTNAGRLVGMKGRVIQVVHHHIPGYVQVESELWRARSAKNDQSFSPETLVVVEKIEGASLIVTSLHNNRN